MVSIEELNKKYQEYRTLKDTEPLEALRLNRELFDNIFESLNPFAKAPDYTNLNRKLDDSKRELGGVLLDLCDEAEDLKKYIQKQNKSMGDE